MIIHKEVSKVIYDEKSHRYILTIEDVKNTQSDRHDILCNRILYKGDYRYYIVANLKFEKSLDNNQCDFSADGLSFYSPEEDQIKSIIRDTKLKLLLNNE